MSFDPDFLELMPHTVTLTPPTGRNAQGQPVYDGSVAKSYRARIVGQVIQLRTRSGAQSTQGFLVYVALGSDTITPDYQLTLPNSAVWQGRNPFIYSVSVLTDEDGVHHAKIMCGFTFHHQEKP